MDKNTIGFINNKKEIPIKEIWISCPDLESEYDSQSKWKKYNSTPADFINCIHFHNCKNYESKNNSTDCVGGYYESPQFSILKFDKAKYSKTIKIISQHLKNDNPIHARTELNRLIEKLGYNTKLGCDIK